MDLTPRFQEALEESFRYHRAQTRKGPEGIPYMGHVLGVASIVIDDGGSEDQVIAALLHDAAEDQGGESTLAEIREKFGDAVAQTVDELSDTFIEPKPEWKKRKTDYLDRLKGVTDSTLKVSMADKLHNVRSIALDRERIGEAIWDRFSASNEETIWYYESLGEVFKDRLGDDPLVGLYRKEVEVLSVA